MRSYDRYLAVLAIVFAITTVVMAMFGHYRFDVFFSVYLVEYLAITLFHVYLNRRAKRVLNVMSYVLLAGFVVIIGIRIGNVLGFEVFS